MAGLDTDALVELVLEQVDSDWRLSERLTAQAVASGGGSLDVGGWKDRTDGAFGDGRYFVPYAEAGRWAPDVFEASDALGDLVNAGHAAAVVGMDAATRAGRRWLPSGDGAAG